MNGRCQCHGLPWRHELVRAFPACIASSKCIDCNCRQDRQARFFDFQCSFIHYLEQQAWKLFCGLQARTFWGVAHLVCIIRAWTSFFGEGHLHNKTLHAQDNRGKRESSCMPCHLRGRPNGSLKALSVSSMPILHLEAMRIFTMHLN